MSVIFSKILVVFAMIAIGYLCCKTKLLPFEANDYLIKLLLNVTSPCILITSITNNELTPDTLAATIQVLVGTFVYYGAGFLVACGIVKLLRVPKEDFGLYTFFLTANNTGFMGFPVAKAAFGNQGLYYMVLSNIALSIYSYTVGIVQVGIGGSDSQNGAGSVKESRGRRNWKQTFRPMLNMCSGAAVLGTVMLFAGIKLPDFLNNLLTPIGDVTIPVSMLILGIQLAASDIPRIILKKKLVLISIIGQTIWPALTFLAVNWLPLYDIAKLTIIYASAFPTMVMIVAIANSAEKNTQLAAEGVALTTLFSVVTLPIATVLLSGYYGI